MSEDLKTHLQMIAELQRRSRPDYERLLPSEFQLKYGRSFEFDASSFKGRRGHRRGRTGRCYENAGKAALHFHDPLIYVEGYLAIHGVPIEHAWNIDQHGKVVELTMMADPMNSIFGYFGVPIAESYLRRSVIRKGTWGVFDWMSLRHLSDDPMEVVHGLAHHQPTEQTGEPNEYA